MYKNIEAGIDYAGESGARITFFTAVPEYELPSPAEIMAHKPVPSLEEHERRSAESARAVLARMAARDFRAWCTAARPSTC